ncbi:MULTISPECIES: hypothetical protein [unclassified Microcoleus]|nr:MULTISPECIES: hypothetical protein [unclassified Microcoleus]MCC3442078.1 hypothetical protein [Microcoleus sp. PH2017_03_ELD_O_A]MCC3466746.1 hypothetical protein [Microcoleus sp. PH2017_06_SFM_O_A]MCC3505501.1 hypothetical protein [Microcoleus sp. PH2017_19_SFW_U_A]MCC3413775.1 hypothetical protein [Microcoleus sp. PH2017_02_FOX_O_A]MCC3492931.1 hypothetical protein [Microcoleus sp. PH2017_16_JOR_D_A]
MNSLIFISPDRGYGFQPIISGKVIIYTFFMISPKNKKTLALQETERC